ncbi:hypothetical protein BBJ28_00020891 [Nothophytophthora sp. Chile5]|nr:hypothetical protein BBJ28_00020891 [Nothophytophthora sp. Chile5]
MGSNQASAAEKRFGMASSLPSKQEKSDPSTAFERSGWLLAMVVVKVRVFTFPSDPRKQNSYVVGTVEVRTKCLQALVSGVCTWLMCPSCSSQGGLLPVVGTLLVDDKEAATVTFTQLRARIEVQDADGMIRRSVIFQEVLALIATAANPHGWPPNTMQTYWFGRFTDENESVPHVIAVRSSTAP